MTNQAAPAIEPRGAGDATAADVVRPVEAAPASRGPRLLVVSTVSMTVEAFLTPYARHFRSLGWKVDVAAQGATTNPPVVEAFDDAYELPVSRSLLDVRGVLAGRAAVRKVIERVEPDIVHVHTPIAAFVTRLAARQIPRDRRPAIVYTAHGFHFHQGGSLAGNTLFKGVEKLAGRWTDRLIVINDEDEAAALRNRIVPPEHLVHMPGIGIDTSYYARSAVSPAAVEAVRAGLGLAPETPLFVIVAELSARKRPQDAIKGLAGMRTHDAHLALAGVGIGRSALEELAEALGVRDRTHFEGFVRDVRPLLCAGVALILPSFREGLARSVMEALSLEVPVLASRARGNPEMVGDDAGVIFDIGDTEALARAMDRIVERPDEARDMGRRGRARMVERYDMPALIRMHEALYAELLAERART